MHSCMEPSTPRGWLRFQQIGKIYTLNAMDTLDKSICHMHKSLLSLTQFSLLYVVSCWCRKFKWGTKGHIPSFKIANSLICNMLLVREHFNLENICLDKNSDWFDFPDYTLKTVVLKTTQVALKIDEHSNWVVSTQRFGLHVYPMCWEV